MPLSDHGGFCNHVFHSHNLTFDNNSDHLSKTLRGVALKIVCHLSKNFDLGVDFEVSWKVNDGGSSRYPCQTASSAGLRVEDLGSRALPCIGRAEG